MRSQLIALAVAGALAACSGSSGPASGTAPITAANAEAIASDVYTASSGIMELGEGAATIGSTSTPGARPRFDLRTFLEDRVIDVLPNDVRNALVEEVTSCGGGSMTMVWNDADNSGTTTSGDSFSMTLVDCDDSGDTISGAIILENLTLSGDPVSGNFVVSMRMTVDSLTITSGLETSTLDGEVTALLSVVGDQLTFMFRLNATFSGGDVSLFAGTSIDSTVNTATGDFTYVANGGLDVSPLGSVYYRTAVPFTGNGAADYPSAGSLLIRGGGGSSVRLTALDATQAQLDVDEDGDGTYETEIVTTWVDLDD